MRPREVFCPSATHSEPGFRPLVFFFFFYFFLLAGQVSIRRHQFSCTSTNVSLTKLKSGGGTVCMHHRLCCVPPPAILLPSPRIFQLTITLLFPVSFVPARWPFGCRSRLLLHRMKLHSIDAKLPPCYCSSPGISCRIQQPTINLCFLF